MKKLLFTALFAAQVLVVAAAGNEPKKVSFENTKVYQQPGSAAEVIATVNPSDEIKLVRAFDRKWSVVEVNGQVGYIQTYKLAPVRKSKD